MANESIGFRSLVEQIQQRDQETDVATPPRGRPQKSRPRPTAEAEAATAPRPAKSAPPALLSRRWL